MGVGNLGDVMLVCVRILQYGCDISRNGDINLLLSVVPI